MGVLVVAGLLSSAEAAPVGGSGAGGRGAGILLPEDRQAIAEVVGKRIQERLGLSQEQWEDIRATLKATREKARTDFRALRQAQADLRTLLANPGADPGALKAAAEQVKALQGAFVDRRIETVLALRSKLTSEQWERWQTLRRGRMGRGWGAHRMGF